MASMSETDVPDTKPAGDQPAPLTAPPAAPWVPPPWLDATLRGLGFAVALALAALTAVHEAFLSALYWGEVRLPLAMLVAVAGNLGLVWFAYRVTGRRLA